eukprot:gene13560-10425_t
MGKGGMGKKAKAAGKKTKKAEEEHADPFDGVSKTGAVTAFQPPNYPE